MNEKLLANNQDIRLTVSVPLLCCYALFSVWQMGIVFFSGTALSFGGKTPLPISVENQTALIIGAYALSIVFLIFFQKYCVKAARIGITAALASAVSLYLPLSNALLGALIALQTFACVFLIGVSISITVNLFTEKSEILDVLISTVLSGLLIAVLQNDFIKVPFTVFRGFTVIALSLLLFFYFKLPVNAWPQYAKKRDNLQIPMKFTVGVYFLIALSCVLTLFGNAVAETIEHGVSVLYLSSAFFGIIVFVLRKRFNVSLLHLASPLIGLSAIGFVLALASDESPIIIYLSSALLGAGLLAGAMTSLYGIVLARRFPSRFVTPIIIAIAVVTVSLHSCLLDAFRDNVHFLYAIYAVLTMLAAFLYIILEPILLWSVNRGNNDMTKTPDAALGGQETDKESMATSAGSKDLRALDKVLAPHSVEPLSGQELRIAELILNGYSNAEMSELLGITENTVKGYRKNLHSKLQIHSRRELFTLANFGKRE